MTCKYAYVKNGDVIKQIKVLASEKSQFSGGANEFIGDFLKAVEGQPICLASCFHNRDEYKSDHLVARVFPISVGTKGVAGKVLGAIVSFFGLIRFLVAHKPERILCGCLGSKLWACFLVSKLYSVPLVHSRHGCGGTKKISRLKTYIDNWCIRRIKAVICHGPYLRELIESIGVPADKIYEFDVTLKHVQERLAKTTTSLPPSLSDRNIPKESKKILYVGRLESSKGIFDLFGACNDMLHKDPDLRLIYVGSGSDEARLKEQIAGSGLQNQVILLGARPHAEVPAIMQACDILVAATKTLTGEGRCMSVMESMVAGTPVIAPDHTAFPFLIKNGSNGLLYKPDSVDDLKKKISMALSDDLLYGKLKKNAAEYGQTLLEPPMTFSQAVFKAFE